MICRKLGLAERRDAYLLDVGCGWGSLALHAAKTYDARVVGVTISEEQAAYARERIAREGLRDRVDVSDPEGNSGMPRTRDEWLTPKG